LIAAAITVVVVLAGVIGRSSFLASGATTINGDSSCGYSGGFTESTVMRWAQVNGTGLDAKFVAFANDENSMLMGVNGATPTNGSPGTAAPGNGGDPSVTDASGRQYFPGLFITPVSGPGSWTKPGDAIPQEPGDWQQGGTVRNISDGSGTTPNGNSLPSGTPFIDNVFGTWITAAVTAASPAPGALGNLTGGTPTFPLSTTQNTTSLSFSTPVPAGRVIEVGDSIVLSQVIGGQNKTITFVASAHANSGATSVSVTAKRSNAAYSGSATVSDPTAHAGGYTRSALPAKNSWNLGGTADAPVGQTFANMGDEGYGTEFRWNVNELSDYQDHQLTTGQWYKIQVIEHDGDQNKAGGDSGEFCTLIKIPGPPQVTTHPVTGGNANANANIAEPLGSTINDSASVADNPGFPNPTGKVTFKLYFIPVADNTTPANACDLNHDTGFSETKDLTVNSTVGNPSTASTSPGYNTTGHGFGTYVWQASYDPNGDTNYTAASETCGAETDKMVDAHIRITPHEATNIVGNDHQLTAHLEYTTNGTTYSGVSGTEVDFTISGSVSGSGPNTSLTYAASDNGATCAATDSNGACTTTINDTAVETVTINATATAFSVPVNNFVGSFTRTTGGSNNTCVTNDNTCGDAIKHYINPTTTLHVTDTLVGLTGNTSGTVTYTYWTGTVDATVLTACQSGTGGTTLTPAGQPFSGATAPTSSPAVDVPDGHVVYFSASYSGNLGSYTSPCTEKASSG
jgi:hypothetical protein